MEALITFLTVRFLPFFMILWVIVNVAVCSLPIEVLPTIFRYGYVAPFYNVSKAVRTIVFHGSADATVHPQNGERIARHAIDAGPRESLQSETSGSAGGRSYRCCTTHGAGGGDGGAPSVEHWLIDGMGHAWSGGKPAGSYTDPKGPDASAEMVRFFFGEAPR